MSAFRRMMSYLGLVDDDEYDEYDPHDEPQPAAPARTVRPAVQTPSEVEPASAIRTLPREAVEPPSHPGGQRTSVVRPIVPSPSTKPHTVTPTTFKDAQEIADRLKAGVSVIVNLQAADRDLIRRIIDFCSGLTYGIGGEMERTADRVYLLTPTVRG